MRIMGVYKITNTNNGKFYIGSSVHIERRWSTHKWYLRKGNHDNAKLQASWNKHGEAAFEFVVLEIVENKDDLLNREQFYLDTMKPIYNHRKFANVVYAYTGWHPTPEQRAAKSEQMKGKLPKGFYVNLGRANKGRKLTPEQCKAMSDRRRGVKLGPHSEETKKKISLAHIGMKLSDEHRQRLRVLHTGRKASAETRQKMSESRKGRAMSDETKRLLSESKRAKNEERAAKRRAETGLLTTTEADQLYGVTAGTMNRWCKTGVVPDVVKEGMRYFIPMASLDKIVKPQIGVASPSEETRRKISEANKGKTLSAETRRKMSESRTGIPTGRKGIPSGRKGIPNGRKGIKHTEETCRKISESRYALFAARREAEGQTTMNV